MRKNADATALAPLEQNTLVKTFERSLESLANTGLNLPDGLPFEMWEELGDRLARVHKNVQWLIADWINFGQKAYGEKYTAAMRITGRDYQALADMAMVGKSIETSRRRETVPFASHREVVSLSAPQQDAVLAATEAQGLNQKEVRAVLKEVNEGFPVPDAVATIKAVPLSAPSEHAPPPPARAPQAVASPPQPPPAPQPTNAHGLAWERIDNAVRWKAYWVSTLQADDKPADFMIEVIEKFDSKGSPLNCTGFIHMRNKTSGDWERTSSVEGRTFGQLKLRLEANWKPSSPTYSDPSNTEGSV